MLTTNMCLLFSQFRAHGVGEGTHDAVGAFFDFSGRQRLVVGTDGQADRDGFFTFGNLSSAVFVRKIGGFEQRARFLLAQGGLLDILPFGIFVKQHRDIIFNHRIFRQMGEAVGPRRIWHKGGEIKLKQNRVDFFDAAGHRRFFIEETEITDFLIAFKDIEPNHVIRPIGFRAAFFQG